MGKERAIPGFIAYSNLLSSVCCRDTSHRRPRCGILRGARAPQSASVQAERDTCISCATHEHHFATDTRIPRSWWREPLSAAGGVTGRNASGALCVQDVAAEDARTDHI